MSTQIHAPRWLHVDRTVRAGTTAERTWQGYALWIVGAAAAGFTMAALFSSVFELSRDWFLVAYVAVVVPFVYAFVQWGGIDVSAELRRNLLRGLVGAVVTGAIVVMAVQRMDASPRADGAALAWDIIWLGVIYGLMDALLLNVVPILGVWRASTLLGHTASWLGKIATGAVGMAASLFVTTAYHLGYAEYRGSDVIDPMVGNMIMSLGYLIFANPITAMVAHIALHIASAIHGVDTTVTLPPHY